MADDVPRSYGRQPVALRGLQGSIAYRLERELRAAKAMDWGVHVKVFWLRSDAVGWAGPDYRYAYVWVAPVLMNPKLCTQIEPFVAGMPGVIQTGIGGGDPSRESNPLRPFVYAVVDLHAES